MLLRRILVLLALLSLTAPSAWAYDEVELAPRPGVTETVNLWLTPGATRNVILLTGGTGGFRHMGNNFVIRIASQLSAAGFNIAAPEVPSDFSGGMTREFRISAEHATDIDAVINLLKARANLPVWLVSTSNGTLSAANVATRIGPPRVAGMVLTSSVWPRLMGYVDLGKVRVPTLVIHNRNDECRESPYGQVEAGMAALQNSPVHELITVSGGIGRSDPCQALSTHGYLGIEDQVVTPMVAWIASH